MNKSDNKIFKIPKHIHTPNYEILISTQNFLLKGELIWEDEHLGMKNQLI